MPAIIDQYEHKDKERLNNPPVGLVDARTDNGGYKKKTYAYDPHIDPQLQWAGKAEHTSFDVPVVSLHVHERIDSRRIIETAKKEVKEQQLSLFEEYKRPLREAIEFYKHRDNWSNRLVAGDSLLVVNSLLEKEGMGGKVQMVYLDPPYGIKYGSNFQPFVNKRDVQDGKDEDLTAEPEMIKAFRDTWELGIHSYLTYLRDRLFLAKELLHESGSVFVQISDENVHLVRCIMDEVFGRENFVSLVSFSTTSGFASRTLSRAGDYIVWYAKQVEKIKYHQLFNTKVAGEEGATKYKPVGNYSSIPKKWWPEEKLVSVDSLTSQGPTESDSEFIYNGQIFSPPKGMHWKTTIDGLNKLAKAKRIVIEGNSPRFLRFIDDFPVYPINNLWTDIGGVQNRVEGKIYVVQTSTNAVERCLLMTTDPDDLVFDPTCGSGTTAYVSEEWGRRWITCDTSRVALTLAKQRLMTACFDYYELAHPGEGVGSGFKYKTVPHVTLKSIANNEPAPQETLYDQPFIDGKRLRVTGPFTVEAVPAPVAKSFDEVANDAPIEGETAGASVARSGETLRQSQWRDELLRSGVRAKSGKLIEFTRVEPIGGTHYLQAEAETREDKPKRVLVCFGPEHAPLQSRMVEFAIDEAGKLKPGPEMVLFCAFQFDEEAAKDVDETNWPGVTLLKAQMNADLFTDDLKKKRAGSESFWLIGQPDVTMTAITSGDDKGKYRVEVQGFDYYNPKTGTVESGGKGDISMWMIDTDYDGRSLFPSQVFFPMVGAKEGWATLAKNLKAGIDEDKIKAFRGTTSLPFTPGLAVAVKIIDARGIESLKIIRMDRDEID
ncbi:MAG: site-specific DNA-methyltransferase [Nitrospirae bacterium]|nr:site-specific DNA-methyltransferase [Nitrospirota bacterium]